MVEIRTYNGGGNNLDNPTWGMAGEQLLRIVPPQYTGGASDPAGADRPNPRLISNIVCLSSNRPPHPRLSDFMWAWGQFLDHELDLTPDNNSEPIDLRTPRNDPDRPNAVIPFNRSVFDPSTGTTAGNPRQQTNVLSSYIDAANVYGSNETRAAALRRFDGSGQLKTDADTRRGPSSKSKRPALLPFNVAGLSNAQGPGRSDDPPGEFFVAGDVRVNEHAVLTCLHTLWMREHNKLCEELACGELRLPKQELDDLGRDEAIYQRARRYVGAKMQAITFSEFLPNLLGSDAIPDYRSYNPYVNAAVSNLFSTVSYRLGHSMLSETIRLVPGRDMLLRESFFSPETVQRHGIEPFLSGLAKQNMQQVDTQAVEEVRTFLFNVHGSSSRRPAMLLDLAALNIQRGRDHGIPDYNSCREQLGLARVRSFEQITDDDETVSRLRQAYDGDLDAIDPWVGGLAEDHRGRGVVGELFHYILRDQFLRLRDGDRFWYENDPAFSRPEIGALRKTTLADIIKRNTKITKLPKNVFVT